MHGKRRRQSARMIQGTNGFFHRLIDYGCPYLRFPGVRHHHDFRGAVCPADTARAVACAECVGGAGNIAYSLKLLGGEPLPMAMLGSDGSDYLQRLESLGISCRYLGQVPDRHTAQAMIMTDRDNNQITAFHPGAMVQAHANRIEPAAGVNLGIIAPDGREAMLQHAAQFVAAGIPFVFDPGQGLPMFDGAELAHFIEQASWVTVNDYEGKLLCDRTGRSLADISRKVRGLVVTL